MMSWTTEAEKRLESYLAEVLALARAQSDGQVDFVDDLRLHIRRDAEDCASGVVTLQNLERALANAGTPSDVVGEDSIAPQAGLNRRESRPAVAQGHGLNAPVATSTPNPARKSGVHSGLKACLVILLCLAILPFVLAVFGMIAAIVVRAIGRSHEPERRAECASHLKQAAVALAAYADAHGGAYPPLAQGRLPFELEGVLGSGEESAWLQCPSARSGAEGTVQSYIYPGYAVRNQEELNALVDVIATKQAGAERAMSGPEGGLRPLASGLSESATIPVLVEWDDHHVPRGGNVLFLDGHVQFIKFPGQFPMTVEFFDAIRRVE